MRLFAATCLALVLATPGRAQVTTVDEGSFTLYLGGDRIGREQFAIHRRPEAGGFTLFSQATISRGNHQIVVSLRADTAGLPLAFSLTDRDTSRTTKSVSATSLGNRLRGRITTDAGEASGEIRLSPGMVVFDDMVVHFYHFVAPRTFPATVHVVSPQRMAHDSLSVALKGSGPVEIGNGSVASRHLTVTRPGGEVTDLWIDAAGRVLRVSVPSQQFLAVRDEPPR